MDQVVGFIADDGLNKDGRTTAFSRKLCVYIDCCEGGRYRRRGDVYAPRLNVCVVGGDEGDMPVDTRTCVPAAVATFVADADGEDVVGAGWSQVWCKVVIERGVAVGMVAEVVTVEPDIAVHVNAIEVDGDVGCACLLQGEVLAVESRAADGVAGSGSAGAGGGEGTANAVGLVGEIFDAPVVREIEGAPGGIVVLWVDGGSVGCFLEFPVPVERGLVALGMSG